MKSEEQFQSDVVFKWIGQFESARNQYLIQ